MCLCTHPECHTAGRHETITHAFLDCPAVAPAVDWLLRAWQVLTQSPEAPPRTAALLLADDMAAWPDTSRPTTASAIALWTRLRVSVLGSIWRLRCMRSEAIIRHQSFARRAIAMAVDSLVEAIQRDWRRTEGDLRQMDNGGFCSSWWRGRDTELSLRDFEKTWTKPSYFCRITGPRRNRQLQLLIGVDKPIAFPA